MIEPGQICRDNTRKTFRIVIVLEPSSKDGKLRVCRWQPSPNPSVVDGRWSAPCALHEHQLDPLPADFDLTTLRGQVVSAAKRSIVDFGGRVRWKVGGSAFDPLIETHIVGTVRP
jgi:hypothetical protein